MTHYWLGGPERRSARGLWGTCYSQVTLSRERGRCGERERRIERERKGVEGRVGERHFAPF